MSTDYAPVRQSGGDLHGLILLKSTQSYFVSFMQFAVFSAGLINQLALFIPLPVQPALAVWRSVLVFFV